MKKALNKRQSEFVEGQKVAFPNAAEDVLTFIAEFKCSVNPHEEEIIEDLFSAGYCYYFALMLKDAFGGSLMYSADRGHIVWLDNREIKNHQFAYDIHGVYEDYEKLVSLREMPNDSIESFRHRGKDFDLDLRMSEFKEEHDLDDADLNERVFNIIPLERRLFSFPNPEDAYRYFSIYVDESEYKGYRLRETNCSRVKTYKPRPYDNADYYWASTEDKWSWDVYYQGRMVAKCVGTFKEVVNALEEYNSKVSSKPCRY